MSKYGELVLLDFLLSAKAVVQEPKANSILEVRTMRLSLFFVAVCLTAGCASVESDWQAAKQADTVAAYTGFRSKHADVRAGSKAAVYVDEAGKRIHELAWQAAVEANSIKSYEEFLGKYAESVHASEVKERLEELEWAQAQVSMSSTSYEVFAKKFPGSRHSAEVRRQLDKLHWESASSENSIASYRAYLKASDAGKTLGTFAPQARSRLSELLKTAALSDAQMADVRDKIREGLAPYSLEEVWTKCRMPTLPGGVQLDVWSKKTRLIGGEVCTPVVTFDSGRNVEVVYVKGIVASYDLIFGQLRYVHDGLLRLIGPLEKPRAGVGFGEVLIAGEDGKVNEQYVLIEDKWYQSR